RGLRELGQPMVAMPMLQRIAYAPQQIFAIVVLALRNLERIPFRRQRTRSSAVVGRICTACSSRYATFIIYGSCRLRFACPLPSQETHPFANTAAHDAPPVSSSSWSACVLPSKPTSSIGPTHAGQPLRQLQLRISSFALRNSSSCTSNNRSLSPIPPGY